MKERYGIVIDSGSSGSRIQIYRWEDSKELNSNKSTDDLKLKSIPQIYQEESWTYKTTPGVSTFGDKPSKVWDDHYEPLIEYAEKIIPRENWKDTPIFILATAGVRLLPTKKKEKLMKTICYEVGKESKFKLDNCADQIQIIDGETEGIYGWIGLNYLMGQLDNYDSKNSNHPSYGFMDMGGASTQISFVPNKKTEIEKHRDDISTVYLRNVNGQTQQWDVFVSTWLGFGANEARKRYLNQLINLLPERNNPSTDDDFNTLKLTDPCLPKNAKYEYPYQGFTYNVFGSGNYEQCLKTTYPLLLKNLPCTDEPCLFNGVHAPEIDFFKDKFVGVSEYWYSANDVFHTGGEYNFLKFSEKVKLFCESDWSDIQKNSANGDYNNLPDDLLKDACFKANWVLNVLHEGFNLPRIDIEAKMPDKVVEDFDNHIPFQSAGAIKGSELSWTLGKIILYASSQIKSNDDLKVGIKPSDNEVKLENKKFIPGGIGSKSSSSERDYETLHALPIFFIFLIAATGVYFLLYKKSSLKNFGNLITSNISKIKSKINNYRYTRISTQEISVLEEGRSEAQSNGTSSRPQSPSIGDNSFAGLRTRSLINLNQGSQGQQISSNENSFRPKKKFSSTSIIFRSFKF
ncbi:Golgi apyrase [Wickerhamomyces ciferrii]|uniref:Golgi apyrase n=1 Tax=Wickerhamomyces ciferrii (strain ATCC 14091 / BCRC 22168 / CBS 111 / JCM 3599 / NBRC 0793 / NRRL Y-1031 F-60-10) TaxID=1206466 RepID=K0KF37_WICCF|nr:Golgi apyrase [Wickerhamomyces ciferrii]CCH41576.1 Golgi apyrase [Wickerhamomyces ciferrii]